MSLVCCDRYVHLRGIAGLPALLVLAFGVCVVLAPPTPAACEQAAQGKAVPGSSVAAATAGTDAATSSDRREPACGRADKNTEEECAAYDGFSWKDVPPVHPPPRLGMYLIFPSGPGFYGACAELKGDYVEKAPQLPYGVFAFTPGSFFDVDFRYLDKPDNTQWDWFDPVKRIHLGDDWLLSLFGQTWVRTMNESHSRLTEHDNNYQLFRTRLAADLWYQDQFRFYAEYLYAERFNGELEPAPIDINRSELLNLFTDPRVGVT